MADYDRALDWQETYRSMIGIANEGFKFLALANGGAVVAILAYLGNVTNDGCSAPDMSQAMRAFLVGLVLCGLAMVFAYWVQWQRLNQLVKKKDTIAGWRLKLALGASVLSLAAFACGAYLGVKAFQNLPAQTVLSSACPEQARKVPDSLSPLPAPASAPADPGSAPLALPHG